MEPDKVRGSDRISLRMGVTVSGADAMGTVFVADGKTILLSRHGAKILLPRKLAPHQEITILCHDTGKEADARVIGNIGQEEDGVYYGIAFIDPEAKIWGIEFPPIADGAEAVGRVILECGGCHTRELVYLDESELEVLENNKSLALHCKRCTDLSVFKMAAVEPGATAPPAAQISTKPEDLRRERRREVRVITCVRSVDFGDDVVRSRNASRGGVCFESLRHYSKGIKVEVAIPYTSGGGNIFLEGHIVRIQHVPGGEMTLYGVQYSPRRH
ncbi:MAG TPA: PilZ domain-containing protein [Terriglobia bacterium]|nr:PilZ domain-containing protein [Terriglobia bacterium]